MHITVHLFARLRELAGQSEVACEVPAGATIASVWQSIAGEFPALGPFGRSVSCALNEDFARMSTPVRDGDTVAFLPPVSGGAL